MAAICFNDCKNNTGNNNNNNNMKDILILYFIDIKLNSKQESLLTGSDMSKHFVPYLLQAQCVKTCIHQKLPHMSIPDPVTLDKFRKRIPYSYLQYSYYQVSM